MGSASAARVAACVWQYTLAPSFFRVRLLTCCLVLFCLRVSLADEPAAAARSSSSTPGQGGVLNLRLVTPNETIVNNSPVYMVTVPAVTGVMGILADHAPTIAQLQPGVVTVHTSDINDITHRLFVSGGFAVVDNESSASITAVEAIRLEDLDVGQARQALSDSQAQLAKASGDKEKAEAQIGVEVLEAVVAALEQTK